jgi:hypothetical protein
MDQIDNFHPSNFPHLFISKYIHTIPNFIIYQHHISLKSHLFTPVSTIELSFFFFLFYKYKKNIIIKKNL